MRRHTGWTKWVWATLLACTLARGAAAVDSGCVISNMEAETQPARTTSPVQVEVTFLCNDLVDSNQPYDVEVDGNTLRVVFHLPISNLPAVSGWRQTVGLGTLAAGSYVVEAYIDREGSPLEFHRSLDLLVLAPATDVPALGPFSLAALALMLAGLGLAFVRRRA